MWLVELPPGWGSERRALPASLVQCAQSSARSCQARIRMAESSKLQLFIKASDDGESIGHCPFCQRLFMVLLLKGVPFTLTTVDVKRSLDVLKAFAPGSQLPVLLYDGEPKTDTIKIEEFLEETLRPPKYPSLVPRYKESFVAGNDVFHKFSAYIKNPLPAQDEALQSGLLKALWKLDTYLRTPLEYELAQDPRLTVSRRRFLDGDQLTLADCSLLPKLNIVHVVCERYRQFGIPKDLRGIWQYLNNAQEVKEFKYTCPSNEEIVQAYSSVDRSSSEQKPLPSPRSPMAPLSPSINGQCQSPRAGGGAGGRI